MKVLILGVNGFIGSNLTAAILGGTEWEVYGLDMGSDKLGGALEHPRFHFLEGDISINREWIAYHIKKCDVCLPLVAIATPATYISDPLRVFNLDFEENLAIVRLCHRYDTRVIFPSTSEVYGMCEDERFDPLTSNMVYGPIHKERWIYAAAKQLLDRVIYAMGNHDTLRYTLFRPFNWVGPGLDSISTEKEGSSRVVTQFLGQILRGGTINLVDGGLQRRCFTWVGDGVEALVRIIANRDGCADRQIFNLGNPDNELTIDDLATRLVGLLSAVPELHGVAAATRIVRSSSKEFYGPAYQDMNRRKPDISLAAQRLGWSPVVGTDEMLARTVAFYVAEHLDRGRPVFDAQLVKSARATP